MSRYANAYEARCVIEDAIAWLRDEDGWTRDDLEEMANESVDRVYDEDDAA